MHKMPQSFLAVLLFSCSLGVVKSCGYDKCTAIDPEAINVHMVSHSHDDVGWVKTVDEYYNGQVQYILDTVIEALESNPQRKFIQVETAFFHKWWIQQTDERKDQVIKLAESGQLEFAGGAWSMNDEATTHYQSIIDGFSLGLRFLNDTIGHCGAPRVGWQIDPFGHSRQMANIFSELGFEGIFFGRLDHRDKVNRINKRQMEVMWRGNPVLGNESDIFTSVLYNLYQPPQGFCFDRVCGYRIDKHNEDLKVFQFVNYIDEMAQVYKSNNILITMGGDFTYTDAEHYFSQIDFLIKRIRERNPITPITRQRINIFYSTPACYLHSVRKGGHSFWVKSDDFFPYADNKKSYWTGYFTSRPTSKRYEREANYYLQAVKQLSSLVGTSANLDVFYLSNSMGIMQHHDAITGTEKQYVANDYARMLSQSRSEAVVRLNERLESLMGINSDAEFIECPLGNMTVCPASNSVRFVLSFYNPLAHTASHHVRIPVKYARYSIRGFSRERIPYQISRPPRTFDTLHSLKFELTFLAEDIPPLGVKYFVFRTDERARNSEVYFKTPADFDDLQLGTEDLGVFLDTEGFIKLAFDKDTIFGFRQQLMFYDSRLKLSGAGRPSGAYIFSPEESAKPFPLINCTVLSGPIFDEIRHFYSPWLQHITRIYKDKKKYIEFDWTVGPIEMRSAKGKEIISRIDTNINNGLNFFTDTNGRGEIMRSRNFRPTFNYTADDNISGNYYPVTSYIRIQDQEDQTIGNYLSVFTDRAQGGSSLKSGQLELMLHRRLVQDDSLGVEEVLNERDPLMGAIARGQHIVKFGRKYKNDDYYFSREFLLKPIPNFKQQVSVDGTHLTDIQYSGLSRELPRDVHLLTLEPFKLWEKKLLIRFEHINESGSIVFVDLKNLFTSFKIVEIVETTLGGNIHLDGRDYEEPKLRHVRKYKRANYLNKLYLRFMLRPTEIRTFIVEVVHYYP